MKSSFPVLLYVSLLTSFPWVLQAQPTTFTLNPLTTFGTRGDGSIQPGDSIGISPITGNDIQISAPGGFGIQPGDNSTPVQWTDLNSQYAIARSLYFSGNTRRHGHTVQDENSPAFA